MPSSSSFTESNDKKLRSNGVFATKTKKALLMFFVLAGAFVVLSLTRSNTTPSNVEGASFVSSFAASNINSSSHSSCYPKIGLRPVKSREELPKLLEDHKLKSGIEIGVKQGSFAKYILDSWKSCEKYHLVDLWAQQENYKDIANVENATHDKFYEETKEHVKGYEEKTEFHRMLSTEAAKNFDKESIDFIYVDARHDYCGVTEDLEHYWPILKPGGIMAGHDYNENSEVRGQDWGLCGDGTRNDLAVKGAVNDFFIPKGLTITVTYWRQHNFMTWVVQKPLC